ncbi:MAG: peptide/nickel transport system permease protein [Sphingobacteriales bacterium]
MFRFIGKRIRDGFLVLLGVLSLVFFIFSLSSSDPSRMLGGQRGDEQTLANIRAELLLDHSTLYRFGAYLNQVSPISVHTTSPGFSWKWDYNGWRFINTECWSVALKVPFLGKSFQTKQSVNQIIAESFFETAVLAFLSILLALIGGVVLAVWKLAKPKALFPKLMGVLSIGGMAFPSFFMAMLIAFLGAYLWFHEIPLFYPILVLPLFVLWKQEWGALDLFLIGCLAALVMGSILPQGGWMLVLPGTGLAFFGSLVEIDPFQGEVWAVRNLWLPLITLAIRPLSVFFQLSESSILEEQNKPYFLTALSKGLSENRALVKHALPNALNPILTTAMGWLASLLAGAVFIEFIFGWKGLGLEIFEALEREDQPVIVGLVLFFSTIFIGINIIVDILYMTLDPRVKASLK